MATQTLWTESAVVDDVTVENGPSITLRKGGDARTLTDVNSYNPVRTHTAKSDWSGEVPYDPTLEDWTFADAFIYWDGDLIFRGKFYTIDTDEGSGSVTRVGGPDVAALLENGAALHTYTKIPAHDAIDHYWSTYTPFSPTVTAPTTTQVASNELVQEADTDSELSSVTSFADTAPFSISSGEIPLLQTCFTTEGEDFDRGSAGIGSGSSYSGGGSAVTGQDTDNAEWDFTPKYDIPDGNVGLQVRLDTNGTVSAPHDWTIDGATIESSSYQFSGPSWVTIDTSALSGLSSGTHTLAVQQTGTGDGINVDVVAPYDSRYSYTFDSDNGGNGGYLDGPQWFPPEAKFRFTEYQASYNVTGASADVTAADTSGPFAIAFSNDGGSTWVSDPNTTTPDVLLSTVGTTLQARVSLGRYGSRTNATPKTGYKGQTIGDWDMRADGNDLPVIDKMTVESSDLSNLQQLHDRFGGRFVLSHSEDSLTASSFQPGDEVRTASWTTENRQKKIDVSGYYNHVIVRGAANGQGGRYSAEESDQAAVDELGEITYVERDRTLQSKAACIYRARTLLEEFLRERNRKGAISIVPEMVEPGYDYEVSAWSSTETFSLEEVSYSLGPGSAEGSLNFDLEDDEIASISTLRKEVSNTKNAL